MTKTKTCQNCKTKFTIEPEDFKFYEKIGVPAPTFCPECRLQKKIAFLANRKFYKRKCDFSSKEIISVFHPDSPFKVYDQKIHNSDKWDPMEYGKEYDFNKPFLEQFSDLMRAVPWPSLSIENSVNCSYCHGMIDSKDCYLASGFKSENCLYVDTAILARDCLDSLILLKTERVYGCIDCGNSYNLLFCAYCDNCLDSVFLCDCRNCQNCFACSGLRNKKYHIFNKPYSKAEYNREIRKYDLGSYQALLKVKAKFREFNLKFPKPWARIAKSVDVTGDDVKHSKNCQNCFIVKEGAEDCKYLFVAGLSLKDSYDVCSGGLKSELIYNSTGVIEARSILASSRLHYCFNGIYSIDCFYSSDLFGCIALHHKKYCILNKQYTKQEYKKMVPKIIKHMNQMPYRDRKGRIYKYGDFFPIEMSRFDYNESWAQSYFPLTKNQTIERGYRWYNMPKSGHQSTIKAKDLPDHINDVDKSILKEVIQCENAPSNCVGSDVFRIIPAEFNLYKKMDITLPRLCPDCRYRELIKQKNPPKLWPRKCMCAGNHSDNKVYQNTDLHKHGDKHCHNKFQTTYAPDRPEIVYCEKCYLKEVG